MLKAANRVSEAERYGPLDWIARGNEVFFVFFWRRPSFCRFFLGLRRLKASSKGCFARHFGHHSAIGPNHRKLEAASRAGPSCCHSTVNRPVSMLNRLNTRSWGDTVVWVSIDAQPLRLHKKLAIATQATVSA